MLLSDVPRMGSGGTAAGAALVGAAVLGLVLPAAASGRGCASAGAGAADASVKSLTNAVICLINRERTRQGLGRLAVGKRLWLAAYGHAQDMRDNRYFAHTSLDGRSFVDRIRAARYLEGHEDGPWTLGEDIAWAPEQSSQPATIVAAFMNSPEHRAVILDPRHVELGVGFLRGTPEGDADGATVVVDFGSIVSAGGLHQDPPAPAPPTQQPPPQSDRGKHDDGAGQQHDKDHGGGHGHSRVASPAWASVTVSAVLAQQS